MKRLSRVGLVIDPQFEYAREFSEGVTAVRPVDSELRGLIGVETG